MDDQSLMRTKIGETGIDSLELMELITTIEDKFKIEINDSLLNEELTIEELCKITEGLCAKAS